MRIILRSANSTHIVKPPLLWLKLSPVRPFSSSRPLKASISNQDDHKPAEEHEPKHQDDMEVTDEEWALRSGRAIDLLRRTLPNFFTQGLVDRLENDEGQTGINASSPSSASIPESIYSHSIQLEYTPPSRLPSPLPQTLHVQGLPLYHASAMFVRRSLTMLYSDLELDLRKVHVYELGAREKKFTVGFGVRGLLRISGAKGEWDVLSTYHVSPASGLIHKHVVESIHPAPHLSFMTSLSNSLLSLSGLKPSGQAAVSSDLNPHPVAAPLPVSSVRKPNGRNT